MRKTFRLLEHSRSRQVEAKVKDVTSRPVEGALSEAEVAQVRIVEVSTIAAEEVRSEDVEELVAVQEDVGGVGMEHTNLETTAVPAVQRRTPFTLSVETAQMIVV